MAKLSEALVQTKQIAKTFRGVLALCEAVDEIGDIDAELARKRSEKRTLEAQVAETKEAHAKSLAVNAELLTKKSDLERRLTALFDDIEIARKDLAAAKEDVVQHSEALRRELRDELTDELAATQAEAEAELAKVNEQITVAREEHDRKMNVFRSDEAEASNRLAAVKEELKRLFKEHSYEQE